MTDAWDATAAARDLYKRFEPLHTITYFDMPLTEHGKAAGQPHYWTTYFTTRVAPVGEVGAETTTALFYNWHPRRVTRAMQDAWSFASREKVLELRLAAATETLARATAGSDTAALTHAAELLWTASQAVDLPGRPLGAANQGLPKPSTPLGVLWQAATTLREHRGDGHNAVLIAHGIGPAEAHFIKVGAGEWDGAQLKSTRQWDDEEWATTAKALVARGLIEESGALTEDGVALHREMEAATDRAAAAPWVAVGREATEATLQAIRPITRAVLELGLLPGTSKA